MKTTKKYLASAYYAQGTILKSEKNQAPTWPQGAPSNEPWTSVDRSQSKKCPVTEESNRRKAQRTANGSSNGRNLWRAYGDGMEQKVGSSLIRLEQCILQAAEIY